MQAVGVFGGTFDPIHYGHLSAAWQVSMALGIAVHMVASSQPPHRDRPAASASQRWQMLNLAVAGHPSLIADRRELDRSGPSYMVDTLQSFVDEFPQQGICLILGQDALNGLHRWHQWERLTQLAHLLVLQRPGYTPPTTGPVADLIEQRQTENTADLAAPEGGKLLLLSVPALEISASHIRRLLASGRSPHFLLPPRCLGYAQREGIYGQAGADQPGAS